MILHRAHRGSFRSARELGEPAELPYQNTIKALPLCLCFELQATAYVPWNASSVTTMEVI